MEKDQLFSRFLRSRSGATAIENALLLGAIAMAGMLTYQYVGDTVRAQFTGLSDKMENAGEPDAGPSSQTGNSGKKDKGSL